MMDKEGFDSLFRDFYPRLMGYAGVLLDDDEARDVVQDVFVYLWEHRSRIEDGDGVGAYLFRLCWSRIVDRQRKRGRLEMVADFPEDIDVQWMEANNDDLIQLLCTKDLMEKIVKLSEELPEKRQKVFRMSFLDHFSNTEISRILDMPKRTVEGHLYHALKFLRGKIQNMELLALLCVYISHIS